MPKGKWAQGITPRNFTWVITDRVAVCERPGGYGGSHRRVRRQEEIIWIREQGFHHVVSISTSPHNLHNYDELGLAWVHRPLARPEELPRYLQHLYRELAAEVGAGNSVLVHHEEVSDALVGVMAGYVVWSGLVPETHKATSVTEQIIGRRLGSQGRDIVATAVALRDEPLPDRAPPPDEAVGDADVGEHEPSGSATTPEQGEDSGPSLGVDGDVETRADAEDASE